jgi:aryl-alcohol dehydrogenase-like predicted oxidoreductase
MSMSGYYNIGTGSDAESIHTIHRALDLGVTHLDTAEIYGPYTNEELVGRAIQDAVTKLCWRRSSASSPTPAAAPASSTAAPRTSA